MKLALVVVCLLAGVAHADLKTYPVEGSAAGDASTGRSAALDVAFKAATGNALDELVTAAAQKAVVETLRTEVLARARLWVGSFKVTASDERDGELVLQVDVRIDVDKLRDKLIELGITLRDDSARPPDGDPPAGARTATLLLRVTTVEGSHATYGPDHDDVVPGAEDAEISLGRRGLALVTASSSGDAARDGEGLPLGDDAARALGRDADAEVAVIAGVSVAAPGRVRGAAAVATLARAEVRVVDVITGRLLGEGQAARGAIGDAAAVVSAAAVRAALLEALAGALPRREPGVARPALPLPAAASGEVLVRIRGATGSEVVVMQADLVAAQGVKKVSLRRFAADEIVLAVKGLKADRIAALMRRAANADARVSDGAVEVTIQAAEEPTVEMPW